jgi:hypothetical protein
MTLLWSQEVRHYVQSSNTSLKLSVIFLVPSSQVMDIHSKHDLFANSTFFPVDVSQPASSTTICNVRGGQGVVG